MLVIIDLIFEYVGLSQRNDRYFIHCIWKFSHDFIFRTFVLIICYPTCIHRHKKNRDPLRSHRQKIFVLAPMVVLCKQIKTAVPLVLHLQREQLISNYATKQNVSKILILILLIFNASIMLF